MNLEILYLVWNRAEMAKRSLEALVDNTNWGNLKAELARDAVAKRSHRPGVGGDLDARVCRPVT